MTKKWFHSKTLWVMFLSLVASIITGTTGEDWFDGDIQVTALSVVGIILRIITGSGLTK